MSWFTNLFKKKEENYNINSENINEDYQNEETVREMKLWNMRNLFFAFWISVLLVAIAITAMAFISETTVARVILWAIISITEAIILFFLLEPGKLKEIERKEVRILEKEVPVIKEVIRTIEKPVEIEKPIYRDVVRIVEKPVIKEVERPVYYPIQKTKRVPAKKYAYVASNVTGVYHKSNCRLGKLIKRKYKEQSNSPSYFKNKKYKPCKSCITKQVKV
jgi:cell division protein FtsB